MELVQVGAKTYYIKNATNIGIYRTSEEGVYLIDSGNDKDAGKKVLKIIEEQGWKVEGIISTHSNADHIGGNEVIQNRTGAKVLANELELAFTEYPLLEPSFLYGGYPFKELRGKFLMAKGSKCMPIEDNLPKGLSYFALPGHFFSMIGVATDDGVYFLGDSVFSEETIKKYGVFFVYDVKGYLETLEFLKGLSGRFFIASHVEAKENIDELIEVNRKKVVEISELIHSHLSEPRCFEDILKFVFEQYGLAMNETQYVLVGSTVRSYLTYLKDEGRVEFYFEYNKMFWRQAKI